MNIKNYIASGILENYVLGLIDDHERKEVEELAVEHPEIKAHLTGVEDALREYVQANAMPLPAGLKAAVMARIDAEIAGTKTTPKATDTNKSNGLTSGLLGLLALILSGACFYFFNQNQGTQEQLVNAQNQFKILKTDCDTQAAKLQDLEQKIAILRDISNSTTFMRGQADGNAPDAIAAVHVNTVDQKAYLDVVRLPDAPTGKQYQLWALVEGQPVDMGVFDIVIDADSSFIEVPFIENAGAFAVTLEDAGGKPTPDLTQLYVIGNV